MPHFPCINVHHNEVSCKMAGLTPENYCSNCTQNRLHEALNLLTAIRNEEPELWNRIMSFRVRHEQRS